MEMLDALSCLLSYLYQPFENIEFFVFPAYCQT